LKYDIEPAETQMVRVLRPLLLRRRLIVAGSLLDPEEKMFLKARWDLWRGANDLVILLAPRHKERFASVYEWAQQNLGGKIYLASNLLEQVESKQPLLKLKPMAVIVLDTLGDLSSVYRMADVAYVGGSLVAKGGHNPLEPARFGVPVVMGQSYENFREIVDAMLAVGGIRIVRDQVELKTTLLELLGSPEAATAMGVRGRSVFGERTGATRRMVEALMELVEVTA
jgi:3-deoxy-D-manno-octulosonic-acid transferase